MHQMRDAILEQDFSNLPLQRNLGDAFAVVCRFFGHTAKPVSQAFGLDKKTAVNALEGKAGGPAITKAIRARADQHDDAWEVWDALGQLIIGESRDSAEERKLQRILESNQHAIQTLAARRARREELRALTAADSGGVDRRRA